MIAKTLCPHCRKPSDAGTHNGCYECGRVKHTYDGPAQGLIGGVL